MGKTKNTFIVVPSRAMEEIIERMGKVHVKDTYHFHINAKTFGKWAAYKDKFDLLELVAPGR
jgi:hypothetical protein